MDISYNNKQYHLPDDLWNRYNLMHPKRTLESLISTLKICYGKQNPTLIEIIELIEDEYELHQNIDLVVGKARKL